MTHTCASCGTVAGRPDQVACSKCGTEFNFGNHDVQATANARTCPSCGRLMENAARFCRFDGTPLQNGVDSDDFLPDSSAFRSKAIAFWNRYGLLFNTTAVLILPALLIAPEAPPIGLILLLPAISAWIVALYDWPVLERLVSAADARFERSYNRDLSEAGKIRRWVIRPILALQARWIRFAERAPTDPVYASLRWFGYVMSGLLAVTLVGLIIYAVIVAILAALMLIAAVIMTGVLLAVMGGGSGAVTHTIGRRALSGIDPMMAAGRRGRELYRDRGGLFDVSERVGRIGKDGKIFAGSGGLFDVDEQVGKSK